MKRVLGRNISELMVVQEPQILQFAMPLLCYWWCGAVVVSIVESEVAYGIKSLIMLVALAEQTGWDPFHACFLVRTGKRGVCV